MADISECLALRDFRALDTLRCGGFVDLIDGLTTVLEADNLRDCVVKICLGPMVIFI